MAIIIPRGLTTEEIRILQEYRRISAETLTTEAIDAIRHPAGRADGVAPQLVAKGYLVAVEGGYGLTDKAREFLAIDAKPAD